MRKLALTALVVAALAAPAGAAVGAKWRVIGSASASGPFPIASANGDVKSPRGLRVRALGSSIANLTIVYSCSKDAKVAPGATVTLAVAGSDTCNVVASGSNDGGKVTIKIEALK
jgi:hypothetical protein